MRKKKINNLKKIKFININRYLKKDSFLKVINLNFNNKFIVKRFFFIDSRKSVERGNHAHLKSTQILFCIKGSIKISITDGKNTKTYNLKESTKAIIVPPLLWSTQKYAKNSILGIFTDTLFNEKDYIRNIEQYLEVINK